MNREICLVVCFLLGMLIYHILKGVCGCDKVVEASLTDEATPSCFYEYQSSSATTS